MTSRLVFVDSSALIAFYSTREERHAEAVREFDRVGREDRGLVISDYILDETVTFLRYRYGFDLALRAWEEMESGEMASLVQVTADHRAEALKIFKKYSQRRLSLTDCVSFALMRFLGIRDALTFGDDFRKANFLAIS